MTNIDEFMTHSYWELNNISRVCFGLESHFQAVHASLNKGNKICFRCIITSTQKLLFYGVIDQKHG